MLAAGRAGPTARRLPACIDVQAPRARSSSSRGTRWAASRAARSHSPPNSRPSSKPGQPLVVGQQRLRQQVALAVPHRAQPAEVVDARSSRTTAGRVGMPSARCDPLAHVRRRVADADHAIAEHPLQRLGDQAGGVREVDEQGIRRVPGDLLGDRPWRRAPCAGRTRCRRHRSSPGRSHRRPRRSARPAAGPRGRPRGWRSRRRRRPPARRADRRSCGRRRGRPARRRSRPARRRSAPTAPRWGRTARPRRSGSCRSGDQRAVDRRGAKSAGSD